MDSFQDGQNALYFKVISSLQYLIFKNRVDNFNRLYGPDAVR